MSIGRAMKPVRSRPMPVVFAALCALSLGACDMFSTSSTYEDAQSAFDQGQFRVANAHLADILSRGEAGPRVRKLQLELMLTLGDGNRAMAAIDQLSDEDLEDDERRVATAHAWLLQGAPAKVVDIYAGLPLDEQSEQDLRMGLWAMRELGENQAFKKRLEYSLTRFPKSPHINALGADQFFDLRLPSEAAPYAQAAFTHGPDVVEARLVAGRQAIFDGDLEKAIEHYAKAHEINPSNPLSLTNVVGLHLDLGQTEEAGKALKIALDNHGDFPFLQWQLARYKLATGDIQGAREAKDRVERIYRDNPEFILLMADIEAAFGNKGLALDNYRRFVREAGQQPEVMRKIAELES